MSSRFHSHFSLAGPVTGSLRAALPAALPDALRVSPPQAPFQPVKGPLCSLEQTLLFRSQRLTEHYITIRSPPCQVWRKILEGFPRGNLGLTGFYPGFLAKRGEGLYDEREFWGSFRRPTGGWLFKNCRWCGSTAAPGFAEQATAGP